MKVSIVVNSGGQSSLEYMIMLALALAVFTIILVASTQLITGSSSQISVEAAQRGVFEIKEAADFVYVHGHPSKLRIKVYVPPNVKESGIELENNKTVYISLDSPPNQTDVYAVTRGNITGNLSAMWREGYYIIDVESIDNIWSNITVVT